MSIGKSLVERHTDATQKLILDTAVDLLVRSGVGEVTVRAVARAAGISERTVFRYYASRDGFLDAVASEMVARLLPPPPPGSIEELLSYPRVLYARYEEQAALVRAALHTEVFSRMREGIAAERWRAVDGLIDEFAPHRSPQERRRAAANLRYYLTATTWHYYRFYFGFNPSEAVACAQLALRVTVEDIGRRPHR